MAQVKHINVLLVFILQFHELIKMVVSGDQLPTDTTFTVNGSYTLNSINSPTNTTNERYIMITFASCAGSSSVGSFTMSWELLLVWIWF